MFTTIDKAWVTALVSFISLTSLQFFGVEISAVMQASIVSVVMGLITWAVPNKPS